MKTLIKIFSLIFFSSAVFYSCNDADLNVTNHAEGYEEGGLIRNDSKLVNYVIGSDQAYTFDMLIYQGAIKTTSVDILKTFTTATGLTSNTILLKNVPVTNTMTDAFSFSTTYDELIEGLEINGEPLPENDSDLAIADYWTLTYVGVTNEGNSHANGLTSKLAVSTRLAGIYTITNSTYVRIDVNNGPFNGLPRIIESVANEPDFATYLATDIGEWVEAASQYYFYVSNTADPDGSFPIIIPKTYDGAVQTLWPDAYEIALCEENILPLMPCTNYARINADGHDEMFLNYGYTVVGSGVRQFYEQSFKN